eukprot:m.81256 g.81256  ORF g.81256 m.81256 type:complete len:85 (-) comp14242_c1_seq1:15-269(-)
MVAVYSLNGFGGFRDFLFFPFFFHRMPVLSFHYRCLSLAPLLAFVPVSVFVFVSLSPCLCFLSLVSVSVSVSSALFSTSFRPYR